MNKAFLAQERTRQHAANTKRVIQKGQTGYSQSEKHREEQRALEDKGDMTEFEKVMQVNKDADIYDSAADDEVEHLEIDIDQEKRSQVRWRAERRKVTGACDKRTIVSRWERMEKFLALANQLTYSEQQTWLDEFKKLDQVQGDRTNARYSHWFRQKARPMQKGQDPVYSSWKQSIWKYLEYSEYLEAEYLVETRTGLTGSRHLNSTLTVTTRQSSSPEVCRRGSPNCRLCKINS